MATEEVGIRLSLKDRAKFSSDAKKAAKDIASITDATNKSQKEANASSSAFGRFRKSLQGVTASSKQVSAGLMSAQIGFQNAEGRAAKAGAGMRLGFARVSNSISNTVASVGKLTGAIGAVAGPVGMVVSTVAGAAMSVGAPLIGAAVKIGAGFAAAGVAASLFGLKTVDAYQQSSLAFEVMLKSKAKADALVKDLAKLANTTPFELQDVTSGAQKLLAMGYAAKDILPMMKSLGNAASVGIVPMGEAMNRLTYAFGQIKATGRVQGDELRQLYEIGVPALEDLAKGFGVSSTEMQKMVKEGLVPASKAIPILTQALDQRFGGLMDRQSRTLSGRLSTLKDQVRNGFRVAFTPLANYLANTGLPWLGVQLGKLGEKFNENKPYIQTFFDSLAKADAHGAANALDTIFGGGSKLTPLFEDLLLKGMAFVGWLKDTAWPWLASIDWGEMFAKGIAAAHGLYQAIRFAFNGAMDVIKPFALVMSLLPGNMGKIGDALKNVQMPEWQTQKDIFRATPGPWVDPRSKAPITSGSLSPTGGMNPAPKGKIGFGVSAPIGKGATSTFMGPKLAEGGTIRRPGTVMVGEKGPERLHLPKSAVVEPLDYGGGSMPKGDTYQIDVSINGSDATTSAQLADMVVTRIQDRMARA